MARRQNPTSARILSPRRDDRGVCISYVECYELDPVFVKDRRQPATLHLGRHMTVCRNAHREEPH